MGRNGAILFNPFGKERKFVGCFDFHSKKENLLKKIVFVWVGLDACVPGAFSEGRKTQIV